MVSEYDEFIYKKCEKIIYQDSNPNESSKCNLNGVIEELSIKLNNFDSDYKEVSEKISLLLIKIKNAIKDPSLVFELEKILGKHQDMTEKIFFRQGIIFVTNNFITHRLRTED